MDSFFQNTQHTSQGGKDETISRSDETRPRTRNEKRG